MYNGHCLAPNGPKCPFGCDGYVTVVAAGQVQRFYSGVGIFNWHYLSSPPQIPQELGVPLESGRLNSNLWYCLLSVQYRI